MRHSSFVPAQDVKASKQTSSGKVSWFDLFVWWANSKWALNHKAFDDFTSHFKNIYIVFRRFKEKGNFERFVQVLTLSVPLLSGPAGRCSLLTAGLPIVPAIRDHDLDKLMIPMVQTQLQKDVQAERSEGNEGRRIQKNNKLQGDLEETKLF